MERPICNGINYATGERVYECDHSKNTKCKKAECYINGGKCSSTKYIEYAKLIKGEKNT